MDVTLVNSMPYSIPRSVDTVDSFTEKTPAAHRPEASFEQFRGESVGEQVREQAMMNLEEVQNFLYMLIGSKIRIDSGRNSIGMSVNTAA